MLEERIIHPIPPLFDKDSRILILGSFPSIKSREAMFFYGHPQNRFWGLLARLFGEEVPVTVEDKKSLVKKAPCRAVGQYPFLHDHRIVGQLDQGCGTERSVGDPR